MKDPYSFDFLSLGPELLERDLERGQIEQLSALILELGKGFSFVGSQYHLEVGDQDFYIDLLFYHLRLRSFVVIELKVEDFRPEFAGKMNFYLSAVDDQLRHGSDNPSIGIILCSGRNEVIVEYALRDITTPMGVSRYTLSTTLPSGLQSELPTVEDLSADIPALSLVKLRMRIEREVREVMAQSTTMAVSTGSMGALLRELDSSGKAPPSTQQFLEALSTMNDVIHGAESNQDSIKQAIDLGKISLSELDQMNE